MRETEGLTRKRTSREPVEALLRPVKLHPNYIDQQRVSNAFLLSSGESLAGATHFKRNPRHLREFELAPKECASVGLGRKTKIIFPWPGKGEGVEASKRETEREGGRTYLLARGYTWDEAWRADLFAAGERRGKRVRRVYPWHAQVEFRCGRVACRYIYIYIPRPRCHPTVDDPPSPVSPRSPPDSSLWSRSILSGLCSPRPRVPFRSLPIQPLAVGRRWYASEDKEEQRRIIVELRRIQGTVSSFTSCVVCSCCSTSSVVFVVTRGPESTTTSPSSSTTCRFTLVSICLVVVISFFFRVSHSSEKRKQELKREREEKLGKKKEGVFAMVEQG